MEIAARAVLRIDEASNAVADVVKHDRTFGQRRGRRTGQVGDVKTGRSLSNAQVADVREREGRPDWRMNRCPQPGKSHSSRSLPLRRWPCFGTDVLPSS